MDKTALLKSIRTRSARNGVLTADRYFRSIEGCFDGGFCPTKLFKGASPEQWAKAIGEAEAKLTCSSNRQKINPQSVKTSGDEISKKGIAVFDAVVTSTKRDRDRDVLETKGAVIDEKMPLLWNHISMSPIGAMLKVLKHTDSLLRARFVIADTELGRDALKLIELGAMRISHGFDPIEYEPLDDDEGWHFKRFEIYETSVVAIPSNTDAVIEAYSRNELKNEAVRAWGKKMFDARPVQISGLVMEAANPDRSIRSLASQQAEFTKALIDHGVIMPKEKAACGCGTKHTKEAFGDVSGSFEELRSQLDSDIRRYFAAMNDPVERNEWAYIHSTFPDHVIVCVCEDYGDCDFYSIAWEMVGGKPTLTGEAVEVQLTLTAVEKARALAIHKGSANAMLCPECGRTGTMDDFCRKDGLGDSQDNIPAVTSAKPQIKSDGDSRQGLPVVAAAQSEDAAWHETFEMLGIH